jgi:hypothetical protein
MSYFIAIEQLVKDFDRWDLAFARHWREQPCAGIELENVTRGTSGDTDHVMLTLHCDTLEDAQRYVESESLGEILEKSGADDPQIYIGEVVPWWTPSESHLDLVHDEIEEINAVLAARMEELSHQIHHTTLSTYRDRLKRRKRSMSRLLEKTRRALSDSN